MPDLTGLRRGYGGPPKRFARRRKVGPTYNRSAVWQPNRAQWRLIWAVALAVILLWPPAEGPSLGGKTLRWLVDPADSLPRLPEELPMALGDNGDAVAAHDEQAAEYYRLTEGSAWIRTRIRVKEMTDPLAPSTARQLLGALTVIGALGVWKLGDRKKEG